MANLVGGAGWLFWSRRILTGFQLYINSQAVRSRHGMAIYDTMQSISPTSSTLCIGQACSMGSFLLAGVKPASVLRLPARQA